MDNLKGVKKMIKLELLVETSFQAMGYTQLIPNRLVLVRELKNGLVQVYVSRKTHSDIKSILGEGRYDWAFKKYRNEGITPAFDTNKFTNTNKHFMGNSWKSLFGNESKEMYKIAKAIQKDYKATVLARG